MTDALRTPLIAAFAVLGLVACASEKTIPVSQPARSTFAPAGDPSRLIYVTPMEGVNGPARLVLADAVAAALRDAGKPAVLAEKANEAGPTVAGKVTGVQARDTVLWVTAEWALQAPYGTPVAEYRQLIVVDRGLWEKGSAEAINLVVSDAGPMIAGMVRDYVGPALAAEPPPAAGAPAGVEETAAQPAAKPAPPEKTAAEETPAQAAPAKPSPVPPEKTAAQEKPAQAAPAKPSSVPADAPASKEPATAATEPPPPAKQAASKNVPPSRAHSTRSKSIGRQPPKPPVALETAKVPPAAARDEKATPAAVAPPEKAPPPGAATQPTLLTKGAPPRQPRPKPVAEAVRTKPLLMPVPDDKPKLAPDPPPVTWSRPSFLIKPVEGAPGDGNVALTNAMRDALRKRDLTVTDDPRQAGFVIEGRVQVGPSVNGRQQTKIVWAVNTITGQEVGKAVQENAVQAGSLDGPWGRIADIVTNAAVVGIQELFGVEEKRASSLNLPPVPPLPNLPQVPGRAMPPPR